MDRDAFPHVDGTDSKVEEELEAIRFPREHNESVGRTRLIPNVQRASFLCYFGKDFAAECISYVISEIWM